MQPHIKIIILNWNGKDLLYECLNSVSLINYPNFSITVIDNNSIDNSIEIIKKQFPKVEIFALNKNYGFAGGYNKYFTQLNQKNVEYVMLLNNDTEVDAEILNSFNSSKKKYGDGCIYGAKIFYKNKPSTIWYAGGNVKLKYGYISHIGIRKKDSSIYCNDKETDYITGCCLFTSTKTINKLNGFNTDFNMYGEDVDFCLRAKKMGVKSYFIPNAKLWHHVSASIGGHLSIKKQINKTIGLLRLIKKYHPIIKNRI